MSSINCDLRYRLFWILVLPIVLFSTKERVSLDLTYPVRSIHHIDLVDFVFDRDPYDFVALFLLPYESGLHCVNETQS